MVTDTSGKKKIAIARVTTREGEGRVRINSQPIELVEPEMARLKMLEPFRIAGEDPRPQVDIDVRVNGGGVAGQADTVRTAPVRGLVQYLNDAELRDAHMEFDRLLLVNDARQSEPKKWGGPGAHTRYQESYHWGDLIMMIPVRCFTCGIVVGEHWDEFKARTREGDEDPAEVLDNLGITRACCRRMMVSHKDLVDVVSPYQ